MHKFSVCNLLSITNSIKELSFNLVINDDLISKLISYKTASNTKFSANLFSINDFIEANELLLADIETSNIEQVCRDYWHNVINATSEWKSLINSEALAIDQRTTYINCQPYALSAYAIVGNYLLKNQIDSYRARLVCLSDLKWNESDSNWKIRKMALSGNAELLMIAVQLILKACLQIPLCNEKEIGCNVFIDEFVMLFNGLDDSLGVNINDFQSSCKYKRFN